LIIGNGAREHAIAWALKKNPEAQLYCLATANNPGILELAEDIKIGDYNNVEEVLAYAKEVEPEFCFIGPEAPLEKGVADALCETSIPCIGPKKELAQLETSKGFTRDLMEEYKIPASPKYKRFKVEEGIPEYIDELKMNIVLKPDGLTGGKGVKVVGDHFETKEEAIEYCKEVIDGQGEIVIEEKLVGQEFSLMSFTDGENIIHMPAVQDNKRAFNDDEGPNTGGMGSYSMPNHSMPFLNDEDIEEAREINVKTTKALKDKFGIPYRGILYGGFIAVKDGVRLIEYNARLGDPEAMNIMTLLASDMVELCRGIVDGDLNKRVVEFKNVATVCKYAVPDGYPDSPVKGEKINVSEVDTSRVNMFYASVDETDEGLMLGGSRAVGIVAEADNLYEAEKICEEEINKIKGPVFHREDIATKPLIEKRIKMQEEVRS
ncbi:phosphoribosylamine--glycine ligase, partial [Patescibacteria group bacterium]|nr:phosphoribosylamine--glycine ligase [Patescibacteria group bacterium]